MPVFNHHKLVAKKVALDHGQVCTVVLPRGSVKAVFFAGMGQGTKNTKSIAKAKLPHLAVVSALPFQKLSTDHAELTRFAVNGIFAAMKAVTKGPVHAIAESQAAPSIILAAIERPELFRSLTLISPLGLNYTALGNTPEARYAELMTRSNTFWRASPQRLHIKGNRDTLAAILHDSFREHAKLRAHMTYGANQNIESELRYLAKRLPVTVYASESDELFPFDEISFTLTGSDVRLKKLAAGHLNRATPAGIAQLQTIVTEIFQPPTPEI